MNMVYVFHFLILCLVIVLILFYFLSRKYFVIYKYSNLWSNTVTLEHIVREIINKACIISIIDHQDTKLTGEDKIGSIIEKASAISADVLLQHNIEPRNYDLTALTKVEIFRINKSLQG